ncbi:unnamed protein product [Enterobius vermicularis]|uniref:Uncharacterized protein n=1 Tax=Enterobius vermicularis TaxID=51028 RepID=A0A0N4V2Q4_ENTVE|nr:unnamed protein product [Enterobius vermicularis]
MDWLGGSGNAIMKAPSGCRGRSNHCHISAVQLQEDEAGKEREVRFKRAILSDFAVVVKLWWYCSGQIERCVILSNMHEGGEKEEREGRMVVGYVECVWKQKRAVILLQVLYSHDSDTQCICRREKAV